VSVSQAKAQGGFQSVTEQSGIKAGDQGFQLDVKGGTTLTGAAITSTQAAIDANKNRLSTATLQTSDLANHDEHKASAIAVSASASSDARNHDGTPMLDKQGKPIKGGTSVAPGIGQASGSQGSTTQSAISAGTVTITDDAKQQALTGKDAATTVANLKRDVVTEKDTSGALTKTWDGAKLMTDVQAQSQITQSAMPRLANEIGSTMGTKADELYRQADQAQRAGDTDKANQLVAEAKRYDEGGAYRIAAHAALGALGGGAAGALGGGTAAAAAPTLNELQSQLQDKLVAAGMSEDGAKTLANVGAGAGAALIGGVAGGTAGAVVGGNADFNNRQLHATERLLAQQLAKKSGGKYTVEQIEDAMRNSGNSALNESIATGMLVDPNKSEAIYDKGAAFTTYDGKTLVQVNRDGSQLGTNPIDPGLAAYIRANTGSSNSPYTAFAPVPAMPALSSSGVGANGLRYEMRTANGQSFRVPVADCPAVSCQNSDNVARYGLNPEDQAQVQAYDAALNKQAIKGVSTIAVVAVAAPLAVEGLAANALLGGAVSGTISAKDQYIDDGKVDVSKTVKDAAVGAVATGALVVAAPVVAAGARNLGQTLDEVVAAKIVPQAEADAIAAAQKAVKVENNLRRDDAQQYVNNQAPVNVPEKVT
jgi:filamentous hemagglutinin